jgi:amino acid transporter
MVGCAPLRTGPGGVDRMSWKQLFATKSLEMLADEAKGENRLRRILGPIGLTSLGVGAIIGAGIFVMTGEMAANAAGPGVLVSFLVAGFACALAAFCYAEFASMAPVAGSAYTYAYATLGELFAWIIGWDLVLEYAMSAATVAASWSEYLNELVFIITQYFGKGYRLPEFLCNDPFSKPGAWFNLPAVFVIGLCTFVLVIGIRESAMSNAFMVFLKLGVVVFVVIVGIPFVVPSNWTSIPPDARKLSEEISLPDLANRYAKVEGRLLEAAQDYVREREAPGTKEEERAEVEKVNISAGSTSQTLEGKIPDDAIKATEQIEERGKQLGDQAVALFRIRHAEATGNSELMREARDRHEKDLPKSPRDIEIAELLIRKAQDPERLQADINDKWGLLAEFGVRDRLVGLDNATRSSFLPYGISGVLFGAAIVFFAFIGFDSISTHSEEAINPQRDLPIGIIASLILCSVLYIAVSAVLTGIVPYHEINTKAAFATVFNNLGHALNSPVLKASALIIAIGALAGMTSVLLITFLSQARIFLAMARDGLLPHSIFGAVHEKFRTPHRSTLITGGIMAVIAGFTPINDLEKMVNIGTLFAFVVVCAAVLILRVRRPEAPRPFRCPAVYVVAPLGILVNLLLMLFLPLQTWWRLVIWLAVGLVLYFAFGFRYSALAERMRYGRGAGA